MKKTRKLLALVLALMMAFSCMAMPAMAAGEDGIMPRGPKGNCHKCGAQVDIIFTQKGPNPIDVGPCDKVPINHVHDVIVYRERYTCQACGATYGNVYDHQICRGGQ